jgi:hypothetical protein
MVTSFAPFRVTTKSDSDVDNEKTWRLERHDRKHWNFIYTDCTDFLL